LRLEIKTEFEKIEKNLKKKKKSKIKNYSYCYYFFSLLVDQWMRLLLPIVAGIGRKATVVVDDGVGDSRYADSTGASRTAIVYEKDENCTRMRQFMQRAKNGFFFFF
jgi:hypothetical protein